MPYFNDDEVNDVYDLTNGYCYLCRKKIAFSNYGRIYDRGAWEIDHVLPLARGGSDTFGNLAPACVDCNRAKSDMTVEEFMNSDYWY